LLSYLQYLASLRAKLKIQVSGPKKGKSKQRIQILDLEHAGSRDDDFDDGLGIMEKEKKFLAELQAKYSRCQLCGPDKMCKIDIAGNHSKLNNPQIRAWSTALVCGFFSDIASATDRFPGTRNE
jgi:hypothetical protein